jgi:hypothetical protein
MHIGAAQGSGVWTCPGAAMTPAEESHPGAEQDSVVKTSPGEAGHSV